MKIVILEKIEMTEEQKERLKKLGEVEFYDSSTLEECKKRVEDADVVVIDWIEPNDFLENMKKGSLLALMSTGYGWIDIKKARSLGISVANIPSYATEAVAEHLFGLLLAVLRRIVVSDRAVRENKFEQGQIRGIELQGKTLGIIGLGRIGKRMAEVGKEFGMNVITYNRTPKNFLRIKEVTLLELMKQSDVISINCDLNPSTRGMIGEKELNLLKKEAVIISATWDIIDLSSLIKKLKNKEIYGAGLDVAIEGKKLDLSKELLELDNVVLTAHIAFNTKEAKIRQVDICLDNIESFIEGKPQNIVNK